MLKDLPDAARGRRRWLSVLAVSFVIAAAVCAGAARTDAATENRADRAGTPTATVTWSPSAMLVESE